MFSLFQSGLHYTSDKQHKVPRLFGYTYLAVVHRTSNLFHIVHIYVQISDYPNMFILVLLDNVDVCPT